LPSLIPILYVSSGFFHPGWLNRSRLRSVLEQSRSFKIAEVPTLENLPWRSFENVRALVLYIHTSTISAPTMDNLDAFVSGGGGLLAIHSAAASFKQEPRYHALLGGRFIGHGPVSQFSVEPINSENPVFPTRSSFWLRDERYLHETKADIQVHFQSVAGDTREPFVWTRQHGAGRVCYCAAGHTLSWLSEPAIRSILLEGLAWAAGVAG
jgi:type 1 glutamine amidotransferase